MSTTIAEGRAMVNVLTRWEGTNEAYGTCKKGTILLHIIKSTMAGLVEQTIGMLPI